VNDATTPMCEGVNTAQARRGEQSSGRGADTGVDQDVGLREFARGHLHPRRTQRSRRIVLDRRRQQVGARWDVYLEPAVHIADRRGEDVALIVHDPNANPRQGTGRTRTRDLLHRAGRGKQDLADDRAGGLVRCLPGAACTGDEKKRERQQGGQDPSHGPWTRMPWPRVPISAPIPTNAASAYRSLMSGDAPDGYETGPARETDLDGVVGLLEAADRGLDLPPEPMREELLWTWHLPTTNLDRDTRILRDAETVIAYGEAIWKHPNEGGPLYLSVRVHPNYRARGIGSWLLAWGESLASERGSEGVRAYASDADARGQDLLRSRGYVHVRSGYTMRKDLEANEDPGSPPAGVRVKRYEDTDERVLYEVDQASFAQHWGFRPTSFESFNEELHGEDWDPSLVFLARASGTTVGYAASFLFEICGYVGILGVLKEWRRRGIGTALLRRSFAELAGRGSREVRLGVDTQNVHGAVALYESVGMSVYRRYDTFDIGTSEAAEQNP
jgi:mycothiol synthase